MSEELLLETKSWEFDMDFFSSIIKSEIKKASFLAVWVELIAMLLFFSLFFFTDFLSIFEFGKNFWEYLSWLPLVGFSLVIDPYEVIPIHNKHMNDIAIFLYIKIRLLYYLCIYYKNKDLFGLIIMQ